MDSLQVIFEDNHLIAINKPAGWLVQGDETGDLPISEVVKDYIKRRYQKPGKVFLGVIHRIDRPVSGVVIFARTSKGLTRMNKLFQDRKIDKTYWAVTDNRPSPLKGRLEHYIAKDSSKNVAHAYNRQRTKDAKHSILEYEMIGEISGHHLLEVHPITGRSHQIRVQLSKMGYPIRGDIKYGFPRANYDGSIHLHCRALAFEHPVKNEPVKIVAEPPKNQIWDLFEGLYDANF